MKYLFLDDIRVPGDVTWKNLPDATWAVVRSYEAAVAWVLKNGFPDVVSFDHDLGYEEYDTTESGLVVVTNATEEKSGLDFVKWLIEFDMTENAMPENFKFIVHSKNPIGEKNIQMLLDNYIRHKRNS